MRERKSIKGSIPAHYSYVVHTKECALHLLAQMEERRDWIKKWPRHCQSCEGSGTSEWDENQSPIGSGHYWPEHFVEPCTCIGNYSDEDPMVCPRCGAAIEDMVRLKVRCEHPLLKEGDAVDHWIYGEEPCPNCGWLHGKKPDDHAPPIPECFCWADSRLNDVPKPGTFQRLMFRIFGDRFQSLFDVPIWKIRYI